MASIAVEKQTATSFFARVTKVWNQATHWVGKVLTKVHTVLQRVCKIALPILTIATVVAAAIGFAQVALVLATIKIVCIIVLMIGASTKAFQGTVASLGKFIANGITGKWDHHQLFKDLADVHHQVANEAKNSVVQRLGLLIACAVLVGLFWLLDAHQSGKVPYVLAGVAVALPGATLVYRLYPQATFVLVACVHVMPPMFWLRNICVHDTVTGHIDSALVACAVLVYSLSLSHNALQTLAAALRIGPLEKSRANSLRRLIRACMSLFVAYLGATSYLRAAREGALILLIWQFFDLLNSVELVIAAAQTAEDWWNQPSTVSASEVFNFVLKHAAALLHAAKTQAIPVWMLALISCVRVGVASFVVLNIFATCSTHYLLAPILAVPAWIFAVCQDAAFLRDVRLGNIDKDPLRRLKYCLNML